MKTLTRTIFLLLIATAWLTTAQEAVAKSKYESVTQKRTETFTGRTDDCTVEVENRYGSVTIENNGTRGEVIVEVSVQIEGRDIFVKDVSEQNDYPKQININGKRPDRITVKNEMQEYVETTFTTEKDGHTHIGTLQRPMDFDGNKVTVHITVRMPKGMNAIVKQEFGNVALPEDNTGARDITLYYADMNGGNFKDISVNAKFADITIRNAGTAEVQLMYADMSTGDIASLTGDMKFSTCSFCNVKDMDITSMYNDDAFESTGTGNYQTQFGDTRIGEIKDNALTLKADYSDLRIDAISASTNIRASFSDVKLKALLPMNIEVESEYDKSFNCKVPLKKTNEYEKNTSYNMTGKIRGGNPNLTLKYTGKYSSLQIR